MIRLFIYIACVAAVATGLAWVADHPGTITVVWLGQNITTSFLIGALIIIVSFAALVLAGWLGILTFTAPKRLVKNLRARRHRIGQEAVRRGIFAASAGDKVAAYRAGMIAKRHVPEEPLALLLEAQSAQMNGDAIASRQAFERMLEKPEMAEVGLRGLYIEAKKAGEIEAAKQFADRALATNPGLAWSSTALFDIQCREGDWRGALKTLGVAKQQKHIARNEADQKRALLLTALAVELEDSQQGKALAYATEAANLAPSLLQASIVAGRILASQGNVSRATKVLAKAWSLAPHPDLALIYAHARTGDSPRDRLARVKTLTSSAAPSIEGDIAVAVAAIEAKEWATARAALEAHVAATPIPSARICQLMARIEAGQHRDAGRAREWLAKASRGAPSPMWVAADGSVSSEWQPLSAVSGQLGAYEWKVPSAPFADAGADLPPEISALDVQDVQSQSLSVVSVATAEATPQPTTPNSGAAFKSAALDAELEKSDEPIIEPVKDVAQQAVIQEDVPAEERRFGGDGQRNPQPKAQSAATSPEANADGRSPSDETSDSPFMPRIFMPGRAPDDPGPRDSEQEEPAPNVRRFRR